MTTDDILIAINHSETLNLADLEQARQLLREHEAWVSIDLLTEQVNEVISTTSIHFPTF